MGTTAQQPTRSTIRILYFALLGGLLSTCVIFGVLFLLGTAPLLPPGDDTTLIATVMAVVAMGPVLGGFFWARGNVPVKPTEQGVDVYWQDQATFSKALIMWVLWEGGGMIGAVGTLLTGSYYPATVTVAALALYVTNGPGYLEERQG